MVIRYQNVDGFEVSTRDYVPWMGLVCITLVGAAFNNERRQREFNLSTEDVDRLLGGHTVECGVVVKLKLERITASALGEKCDCLVIEETGEQFVYCFEPFLYGKFEDVLLHTLPLDPPGTI